MARKSSTLHQQTERCRRSSGSFTHSKMVRSSRGGMSRSQPLFPDCASQKLKIVGWHAAHHLVQHGQRRVSAMEQACCEQFWGRMMQCMATRDGAIDHRLCPPRAWTSRRCHDEERTGLCMYGGTARTGTEAQRLASLRASLMLRRAPHCGWMMASMSSAVPLARTSRAVHHSSGQDSPIAGSHPNQTVLPNQLFIA
jgi:hypothetical protein